MDGADETPDEPDDGLAPGPKFVPPAGRPPAPPAAVRPASGMVPTPARSEEQPPPASTSEPQRAHFLPSSSPSTNLQGRFGVGTGMLVSGGLSIAATAIFGFVNGSQRKGGDEAIASIVASTIAIPVFTLLIGLALWHLASPKAAVITALVIAGVVSCASIAEVGRNSEERHDVGARVEGPDRVVHNIIGDTHRHPTTVRT